MYLEKMRCSITKEKVNSYRGTVPEAFTAFNKYKLLAVKEKMDLYNMQF